MPLTPPTEIKKPIALDTQLACIRYSTCGTVLFAAAHDGSIRRFNMTDPAFLELPLIPRHNGWVSFIAVHAKSKRLYSCDSWGRIACWDTPISEKPKLLWELKEAHPGWVRQLAFSPDGSTLASCGRDGVVKLWNPETGKAIQELVLNDDLLALAFHPSGELFVGDLHGKMHIWNAKDAKPSRIIESKEFYLYDRIQDVGGVRCITFDTQGEYVLVGGALPKTGGFVQGTPHLFVYDWKSGKRLHTWKGTADAEGFVHDVQWHPDGYAMAVTSGQPGQGKVLFWKPGEEKPLFLVAKPNCHSLDLNPERTQLAVLTTNANSSGNGRVKGKNGEYPANTSPIYLWTMPKA